jgi:hypothetical protein
MYHENIVKKWKGQYKYCVCKSYYNDINYIIMLILAVTN